jgi:hypothetical protein
MYSRVYQDPFEFQAGTGEQDFAVLAYEPFVRQERLIFGVNGRVQRERALHLARQWDLAAARGELKPLHPVGFEDSCSIGVRGGIRRSLSSLVTYLLCDAELLTKRRRISEATDQALLALRLLESMKYGDFDSISSAAADERQVLNFLARHKGRMGAKNKDKVRRELVNMTNRRRQLLATTQAANVRFYDYKSRAKSTMNISEIRQTAMIGRRMRAEGRSPRTLALVRKNYIGADDHAGLEHLFDLRTSWRAEEETRSRALKLLKTI